MKNYVLLKRYSKYIFFAGSGNFWYEEGYGGNDAAILYRIYQVVLFSVYIFMTVLEVLAAILGDFPKDEKSDSVTFAVSHTVVLIKMFCVIRNKDLIKSLNKKMVTICEEHEEKTLMDEKYKIIKMIFFAYVFCVYGCMLCFISEGFRKIREGSHFVTVVTYYPSFEDNSPLANFVRVACTFTLIVMLITMIVTADAFTMLYLIMFKYKFITLRNYLNDIRVKFDRESSASLSLASNNLKDRLIKGVKMHAELLDMCKEIDTAFGMVIAMQLCQSSGSAVSLMLQIAISKNLTVVAIIKLLSFVVALFFLLALFTCNAGEITYQASLISDAVFQCGWHACESKHRIGRIVQLTIMRAQRPLVIKAFKMVEMTYATLVTVARATYSIFALFHAQNN